MERETMQRWIWCAGLAVVMALVPFGSEAQLMVMSSSVQERAAARGERYEGVIQVRNQGRQAAEVRVYQTDYLFYADGRSLYPAPGTHARSNAGWLRVTSPQAVVPAGGEAEIAYTVSVPGDGATGTSWSMVMVEQVELPRPDEAADAGVGVRVVVRFGIQIATHVRGDAAHRLDIIDARVTNDSLARALEFSLSNEGAAGYRPLVTLELYGETGAVVAAHEAQRGLLYPGTSALQRFDLGDIPPGSYQALVVVDTGAQEVFGAQFALTLGQVQ